MDLDSRFDRAATDLTALAHPARLAILCHLSSQKSCCCRDVVAQFDLAQSTVSQHLKVLVEAGFVRFEARGQKSHYAVDRDAIAALSQRFAALLDRFNGTS